MKIEMPNAEDHPADDQVTVTVTGIALTQWAVSWFPPEGDKVRIGTESQIRAIAAREAEWNPIVQSRVVVIPDWQTVENHAHE